MIMAIEEHAGWIEFNRAGYNLPHFAADKEKIELAKIIDKARTTNKPCWKRICYSLRCCSCGPRRVVIR